MAWIDIFVLANILQFAFGVSITGISYWAYRSNHRKASFRNSTVGFLFITVGGVLAPIYELGIKSDYTITAQELLKLQIIEGTVIGVGLAFLLVSVYSHSGGTDHHRHIQLDVRDGGRETER
ncbi:DUF7521 family protein [Halobellus captivus]|uniref:DUF7521 family protein n=1 Tax=Halobellus captivus TaxID=2592614 RepID=UPI0011A0AD19|nr:hypothetical protein [Halobellus captivus]